MKITKWLLPIILLGLLVSCKENTKYLGGIHVNEPDKQAWCDALKNNNMNTVSVTVYAKQGNWDSDNFWHNGIDENIINEIRIAKKNNLKVVLILRTALDHAFPKNQFLWHGMIMPANDSLLINWFDKYEQYVCFWAKIAKEEGIDILGVGSELKALTNTHNLNKIDYKKEPIHFISWYQKQKKLILSHEKEITKKHLWVRGNNNFNSLEGFLNSKNKALENWANQVYDTTDINYYAKYQKRNKTINTNWNQLIKKVKTIYNGKVTYAANFDNYHNITFWNKLDFIGINAYFKLRKNINHINKTDELTSEFNASWDSIFTVFNTFKDTNNITTPIVFTELGYTFREYSTIEPWAHNEFSVVEYKDTNKLMVWYEQNKNLQERDLAIQSLIKTNKKYNEPIKGILYWKLSTNKNHEKYEEFLLPINKTSKDPLLKTLSTF